MTLARARVLYRPMHAYTTTTVTLTLTLTDSDCKAVFFKIEGPSSRGGDDSLGTAVAKLGEWGPLVGPRGRCEEDRKKRKERGHTH